MGALVKDDVQAVDHSMVAALASAPARLAGSALLACQSDERLVVLARAGHERAFDALVERYRRPLVRFCTGMLPESRAEDAAQQAFVNVHAALARGDEPSDFKPWLYKIARNASLNMVRQNGWSYDQLPLDYDGVRRPEQVVEQRIELQQTVAAIGELPERQRRALVMRELEGRSYTEIAALLGAGDGAVRQLLNRARLTLRSAATMLTPPQLVARAAESYQGGDGSRVSRAAELLGGLGAGGAVKAGATALVAGTLVVGAVQAPLPILGHDHGAALKAKSGRLAGAGGADAGAVALAEPDTHGSAPAHPSAGAGHGRVEHGAAGDHGRRVAGGHGEGRHDAVRREGDDGRREAAKRREDRSGSGDRSGSEEQSGSRETSGSGEHSVSGDSGDAAVTGTSESGTGSAESVTSGSGSDDSMTTTSGETASGTSGSSDSGTSGSGTSDTTTSSLTTTGSETSGSGTSGSD